MKYVGWLVAAALAVALFWVWTVDAGAIGLSRDQTKAAERVNDSLRKTGRDRDRRVLRLIAVLDSVAAERDSAWAHVPPAETLYIGHRAQAASLSYRRKWNDMGVLPRDTTTAR